MPAGDGQSSAISRVREAGPPAAEGATSEYLEDKHATDEDDPVEKWGNKIQGKVDDWLEQNVNEPLAAAGHEDLGAGLAATGSAATEMLVPKSKTEAALAIIPEVGPLAKEGSVFLKETPKLMRGAEEVAPAAEKVLDYSSWARKPTKTITQATTGWEKVSDKALQQEAAARGLLK